MHIDTALNGEDTLHIKPKLEDYSPHIFDAGHTLLTATRAPRPLA